MFPIQGASEEAIAELKALGKGDPEIAHSEADKILCRLLETLGFHDVVVAYNEVEKWYT